MDSGNYRFNLPLRRDQVRTESSNRFSVSMLTKEKHSNSAETQASAMSSVSRTVDTHQLSAGSHSHHGHSVPNV